MRSCGPGHRAPVAVHDSRGRFAESFRRITRMGNQAPFILSLGASAALLASCVERTGPGIDFFIPPAVHGLIVIVEDKQHGDDVDLGAPVFFIPTNGVLRVKTLAPFQRWHVLTARYIPGGEISRGDLHDSPNDDVVRLFGLGSSSSRKDFYFLGTRKQAGEAHGNLYKID